MPHEPLTAPVFHILLALADQERHGYAIMQDVARQTEGRLQMGPGTLYGCLKRMLAEGMVEESSERDEERTAKRCARSEEDPRRRHYRLTALGRQLLREEVRRLEDALAAARSKKIAVRG